MPELLLEVGTEELPASAVRRAYTELGSRIAAGLEEAGILDSDEPPALLGTPRRLIVSFGNLIDRQPDTTKELRGPGVKAAFDGSGNPSPALLGFCRSQSVDPGEVRSQGDYVWVT